MSSEIESFDKEKAKSEIKILVERYEREKSNGRLESYSEEQTKQDFILPLFAALGWDVYNRFGHENTAEERISTKAVDYAFRLNDIPKLFIEAKSFKAGVEKDEFALQAIAYAYNKGGTWAILTNFETLIVFNAEWKGNNAYDSMFFKIRCNEYLDDFERLFLLSKESILYSQLDKVAEKWGKKIKRTPITEQLFSNLTEFRQLLSKDISKRNESRSLTEEELDESVQRILDRLIFIRTVEDREFESLQLRPLTRENHGGKLWKKLAQIFRNFDDIYNSGLFKSHESENLIIDDSVLETVIRGLYETQDRTILYDFSAIDADVLGSVYEQYLGHILKKTKISATIKDGSAKRKEHGIYYTPVPIVDYIVKHTLGQILKDSPLKIKDIKIIDPACGSGSFLIKALDYILIRDKELEHRESMKEQVYGKNMLSTEKFGYLTNSIFGVDLDAKAVEIAQLNLLLKTAERKTRLPTLQNNIKHGNSLIEDKKIANETFFKWEEQFPNIVGGRKFDVVIGNPPYFNIKSDDVLKNISDYKLLSNGVVNIASLFIKKGLDLLRDGGYLGFIIPKSFLNVDSWEPVRSLVLKNSLIEACDVSIAFEEVGLEQVIIIVKKQTPTNNMVKILQNFKEINNIPQEFFIKRGSILTALDEQKLKIIEKIEKDSISLSEIADMPRGITVISTDYSENDEQGFIQVLGGTNVERYSIKEGNTRKPNRYLSKSDKRIQAKNDIFNKERIIYQNLASSVSKIVATMEHEPLPTDDTLNNLFLIDSSFNIKYILAILNSKLITFYLRYAIINCSILTVHLDKPYVGKFPIKKITEQSQKEIANLVDEIISINSKLKEMGDKQTDKKLQMEESVMKLDNQINTKIFSAYEIIDDEQKIIETSLERS